MLLALVTVGAAACGPSSTDQPDEPGFFLDGEGAQFAADADARPYAGPAPLTVQFTASTVNPSGRVSYAWNFDDRARSSEQNPTHTFRRPGWYLVTMDARDAAGRTYRMNLQVRAWRPRDWARMQKHYDPRIVARSLRELERKRRKSGWPTTTRSAARLHLLRKGVRAVGRWRGHVRPARFRLRCRSGHDCVASLPRGAPDSTGCRRSVPCSPRT